MDDNENSPKPDSASAPEVEPKHYIDQTLSEKRLLDIAANVEKAITMVGMLESGLDNKLNAFLTTLQIHLNMPGAPSAKPRPHEDVKDGETGSVRVAPASKRDYRRSS